MNAKDGTSVIRLSMKFCLVLELQGQRLGVIVTANVRVDCCRYEVKRFVSYDMMVALYLTYILALCRIAILRLETLVAGMLECDRCIDRS